MTDILCPERLDSDAAEGLLDLVLRHRHEDICLDFSAVTFLGALSVQVLNAADRQWAEDKVSLKFTGIADALAEDFTLLGAGALLQGRG